MRKQAKSCLFKSWLGSHIFLEYLPYYSAELMLYFIFQFISYAGYRRARR